MLICTIESRAERFALLRDHLRDQRTFHGLQREVEILSEIDNKEMSVGAKRQKLLNRAGGDFVVFIDDDDWVPFHYLKVVTEHCVDGVDCIGFEIICKGMGRRDLKACASNRYAEWADNVDGYRFVRTIYHKTPVRRSHALAVGFKDMRFAEDADYAARLKSSGLLKNERFIKDTLYEYRYQYEPPRQKYGFDR